VLWSASLIATFMAMHYKHVHWRQRPSQLAPALMPPVEVPGHPSYPSGHATQAHLMAECAILVLPAAMLPLFADNLRALARRIARNREIAGLHYASDSAAGAALAGNIHAFLQDPVAAGVPFQASFLALLNAATAEWA
jgi:membrane-associated phospholipid phosphatase